MTEKEMVDRVVYLMTNCPTDEDYEEAHLLCDKLIAIKRDRESVKADVNVEDGRIAGSTKEDV